MDPYLLALLIILAYVAIVYFLKNRGILEKYGLQTYGPMIMWKTLKGRDFIDRIAGPKRFWRSYATLAKVICLMVMIFIMSLLIWEATLVTSIPADKAPSPQMLIGLPGINPIIPIWYGILGLVVAVIVHEFAHGIQTRVGGMNLRSLGVILFIVPLGAFVEPDEEEIQKTSKKKRSSIYAAGPATNIILAVICALLFSSLFMASVAPVRDSPVVVSIADNGPASHAGLLFGSQIVSINGMTLPGDSIANISVADPGQEVSVNYYYNGQNLTKNVVSGVMVTTVSKGYPADQAGINNGMILASINNTIIRSEDEMRQVLASVQPNQPTNITVLAYDQTTQKYEVVPTIHEITPMSKKAYYLSVAPQLIGPDFKDTAFLGINSAYMGMSVNSPQSLLNRLAHPLGAVSNPGDFISSTLVYIALPFMGLAPIQSSIASLYAPTGILAGVPGGVFWTIANSLYWIFWINLMVGMTNALPAVPLDGGFLFRDWIDSLVERLKKDSSEKQRQRYVALITYTLAVFVLALIVWQLIGPRIA